MDDKSRYVIEKVNIIDICKLKDLTKNISDN